MDFNNASPALVTNLSQTNSTGSAITWSSNKFTVNADGLYTFTVSGNFNTIGIERAQPTFYFYVNGSRVEGAGGGYLRNIGDAFDATSNLTRTFDLTANDYVELYLENTGRTTPGTAVRANGIVFEVFSHEMTVIGVNGTIGATTLIQLTDTPASIGSAGQVLVVNSAGTAFEFANQSGGSGSGNQRTLILPTTNDYSGDVVTFGGTPTSGSFTEGALYYYNGANWELAYGTQQQSSTGLLGICVDATTPELLVRGVVTNSQFGTSFTSGNRLYVSAVQGGTGKMMDSIPASPASGSVLRAVGYVINGTNSQVMFDPSQDFITFP
jgi:hypothetical protein